MIQWEECGIWSQNQLPTMPSHISSMGNWLTNLDEGEWSRSGPTTGQLSGYSLWDVWDNLAPKAGFHRCSQEKHSARPRGFMRSETAQLSSDTKRVNLERACGSLQERGIKESRQKLCNGFFFPGPRKQGQSPS